MNRLLVTRMATVPVSLDVLVAGIGEVGAVEEAEHVEMVNRGVRPHIGRMEPLRSGDPLPTSVHPLGRS
jgi:hypothetical protein